MANPQFIEEKPVALADVKEVLLSIEKRDTSLGIGSAKAKEYIEQFVTLSPQQKEELYKKLTELNVTRLREEQLMKVIDFLPGSVQELKVVLQAYPLSLSKKDQDSIIGVVKDYS